MSPTSSAGITTGSSTSTQQMPPYTPTGYSWPQSSSTQYGYHSTMSPSAFAPSKAVFSPSVNTLVRGNSSPSASELPPPPYGAELPAYPNSVPVPTSLNLPSLPSHHSISSHTSAQSPHHAQGPFTSRPPPVSSYSYGPQSVSAPAQSPYPYSAGPSPVQQSPISAGGAITNMSPASVHGPVPSPQQAPTPSAYTSQRPYSYPLPGGPVLSNVNNPNSQLALVGMHGGMMPSYNSGHAAQMQQMYGHAPAQPATNDRPFKCDQCPQSFNRNHDLKRHKRIHLAVKPFPCGHCEKSFSRKDALKVRSTPVVLS